MARRKQQQKHTFHGNKPAEQCILRKKNQVSFPDPEGYDRNRKWQTFPSISQAKHFCLEQMRKGAQIREVK